MATENRIKGTNPSRDPIGDAALGGYHERESTAGPTARHIPLGTAGYHPAPTEESEAMDARDARRTVSEIVECRQREFRAQVSGVLGRTSTFTIAVSHALGNVITRDEAIDALKREFVEGLERLR